MHIASDMHSSKGIAEISAMPDSLIFAEQHIMREAYPLYPSPTKVNALSS